MTYTEWILNKSSLFIRSDNQKTQEFKFETETQQFHSLLLWNDAAL